LSLQSQPHGEIYLAIMNVRDTRQRERHIRPRITDSAIGHRDSPISNGSNLTVKDVAFPCRNDNSGVY
jgi:hypothetical protein